MPALDRVRVVQCFPFFRVKVQLHMLLFSYVSISRFFRKTFHFFNKMWKKDESATFF